jgi:hypothetical protein
MLKNTTAIKSAQNGYFEIPGYSRYLVNEYGNIVEYETNKKLETHVSSRGYLTVRVYSDTSHLKQEVLLHRLVSLAFYGEPVGLRNQVNHKDGNKQNNHYTNLEWCTSEENMRHAWDEGLCDVNLIPVKVMDVVLNNVTQYPSIKIFHRESKINYSAINSHLKRSSGRLLNGRYIVKYSDDISAWPSEEKIMQLINSYRSTSSRQVLGYSLKDGSILFWPSTKSMMDYFNLKSSSVFSHIANRNYYFIDNWLIKNLTDMTSWDTIRQNQEFQP